MSVGLWAVGMQSPIKRFYRGVMPLVGDGWRSDVDFKLVRLMFLHHYELPQCFDYMSCVPARALAFLKICLTFLS